MSDSPDYTFNCFDSTEIAFSPDNNCLYFMILLIWGLVALVIIIALGTTICCMEQQRVDTRKRRSYSDSSSSTESVNNQPFTPTPTAVAMNNAWANPTTTNNLPRFQYNENQNMAVQNSNNNVQPMFSTQAMSQTQVRVENPMTQTAQPAKTQKPRSSKRRNVNSQAQGQANNAMSMDSDLMKIAGLLQNNPNLMNQLQAMNNQN